MVSSSIARTCSQGVYLHTGIEIGVASTKAFTAQIAILIMIALKIAIAKKTLSNKDISKYIEEFRNLPSKIRDTLRSEDHITYIASIYQEAKNFLYLGRGSNFPVALEGALKLKEISYIHAEGYPAAEMKHGPIALIDENMPVVFIATKDNTYDKVVSNIEEIKSRKGKIIALASTGDETIKNIADHVIEVPKSSGLFSPIINTIPLQLLAYHIAMLRNCNVDQPRNLAKSVTVE